MLRVIDFRFGIFYIIYVFCATSEHADESVYNLNTHRHINFLYKTRTCILYKMQSMYKHLVLGNVDYRI